MPISYYGDFAPYGADHVYGGENDDDSNQLCICKSGWRIDATELETGQVKAVLHCTAAEWEDVYSAVGVGRLTTFSREPSANDIFPHNTGIYISRILNTKGDRYVHWGGLVEGFGGVGDTTIGLQSIDKFLFHRNVMVPDGSAGLTVDWHDVPQQDIAYALAEMAMPRGIPLFPVAQHSTSYEKKRDVHYNWWEFKNIGAAIQELTQLEGGLRYRLRHEYHNGYYKSYIVFDNDLSTTRTRVLKSDREVYQFDLEVDASNQCTRAFVIGEGEEAAQKYSIAYDAGNSGVEWHATPAFKDVADRSKLDSLARGYVASFRDPVATPSFVLAGLETVPPDQLLVGDITPVDLGFGVATFKGDVQVLSQAWRVDNGTDPVIRNVAVLPLLRSSQSVRTQVPIISPEPQAPEAPSTPVGQQPPPTADPEPKPGLVCKISDSGLTESSYMIVSRKIGNVIWTGNDEPGSPQIRGYDLKTGKKVSTIKFDGVTLPADPEALAMDPQGRMNLGDLGDNNDSRSHVYIYRFAEPSSKGNHTVTPNRYTVEYDIGSQNAECLLINPITGRPWIITKENHGRLLKGPATIAGGTNLFEHQSGHDFGKDVSDGCFTPNGKYVVIRRAGQSALDVYRVSDWKKMGTKIPMPSMPKSEAVCMENNKKSLLSSTEIKHFNLSSTPIYRALLPKAYR